MSPWRQEWQCGWFENDKENNLPSSETLVQSDGIHKSLIAEATVTRTENALIVPKVHSCLLWLNENKIVGMKVRTWSVSREVGEIRRNTEDGTFQKPNEISSRCQVECLIWQENEYTCSICRIWWNYSIITARWHSLGLTHLGCHMV